MAVSTVAQALPHTAADRPHFGAANRASTLFQRYPRSLSVRVMSENFWK